MVQTLKKNALLKSCVSNGGDIFEVIKTQRKAAPTVATTMA